jgi:signal transduction histidine kinase/CheY-like chemotaxis protein
VIGQPIALLVPPDLPDEIPRILERLRCGERVDHYETQRRRKDGTRLDVSLTISPIRDSTGRIIGASKIARDITERKQAEAALQQAYAELEQRVEERTALLALIQGITRAANEATSSAAALQVAVDRICAYTGWPVGHAYLAVAPGADRWAPTSIWHLAAPERFTGFQQATQTVEVAAGEGLIGQVGALGKPEWRSEVATDPAFHRQHAALEAGLQTGFALPVLVGHEVAGVLEFYTTEILAPHGALLDAMTQIGMQLGRIVERERAAEQLQRQQAALSQREKLAAMGSLLASVAHELNNPLAIVLMQADLLREDAGNGPLAEAAEEISQAATRCERLVRQFLTLARQHAPERTAVDFNALITDTIEILAQPLQIDNIVVKLRLAGGLPRLWADPHQLQQVLVNLLTNAHQALRDVAPPRQVTLTTRCDLARTQVTLEVADTGPGIPPALRARIFEPFFTTKPPGVGTGLGLSLCQGIIEGHGGTLSVTSPPGRGTTFHIALPIDVVLETLSTTPDSEGTRPTVPRTAILVVDDEPGIAKALTRLLCRDGHTVDTATNGRLALAKLQERPYDLILSDLRMPDLDGPGLYRTLEEHAPQLCRRFIFLTGDTLSPETLAFFAQSGVLRLTKPFTAAEVRRAIQQVLQAE